MKLFISTPCFGGQLENFYVGAILSAIARAEQEGLVSHVELSMEGKESLIPRGRNKDARAFMVREFDKLLTIDADISFTYEDFKKVITSKKDIVAGVYPLKTFPVVGNFNPLPHHRAEFFKGRGMDIFALDAFEKKYADPETKEVEVEHVPTGFMCVTRKVFLDMAPTVRAYRELQPENCQVTGYIDYYTSGATEDGQYMSEDWGFCRNATKVGYKIYVNTSIRLGHVGKHVYRLGQIFVEGSRLTPPAPEVP